MCDCLECQLGDNPTDEQILSIGGCPYCSMTGWESYPSYTKKCRLGHKDIDSMFGPLPPLPEPVNDRPTIGGPWKWTGRGWKNLGYKKKT